MSLHHFQGHTPLPAPDAQSFASRLDHAEATLLREFHQHPLFSQLATAPRELVQEIALQRRFLSLAYTPILDTAIDLLTDVLARDALRLLIRAEYPADGPSHREDLTYDLAILGVSQERLRQIRPSSATMAAITGIFDLIHDPACPATARDLMLVSAVRWWGEVLVAEEFDVIFPAFERFGLTRQESRFYWPHVEHDRRESDMVATQAGTTHADMLAHVMKVQLTSDAMVDAAVKAEKAVWRIKAAFYHRFLDRT